MEAELDAVVLVVSRGVRTGDQGDEVRREWTALQDPPRPRAQLLGRTIADHRPILRNLYPDFVAGLQVGLVETGKPPRCRVKERHAVEVDMLILGVNMAMETLTVGRKAHPTLNDHGVMGSETG